MKKLNLKRKIVRILEVSLMLVLLFTNFCFATEEGVTGIQNTVLVKGTQQLISDLTSWLLVIAPTLTILLIGYYLLRKSASDEMDGKRWDNRVKIALICCVGVVVASGLINALIGYYK